MVSIKSIKSDPGLACQIKRKINRKWQLRSLFSEWKQSCFPVPFRSTTPLKGRCRPKVFSSTPFFWLETKLLSCPFQQGTGIQHFLKGRCHLLIKGQRCSLPPSQSQDDSAACASRLCTWHPSWHIPWMSSHQKKLNGPGHSAGPQNAQLDNCGESCNWDIDCCGWDACSCEICG